MTTSQIEWLMSLKKSNGWHIAVGLMAALLTYVISLSIYSRPPIKPTDVVIFVKRQVKEVPLLMEVRSIVGREAGVHIDVSRRIYKEGNPSQVLVLFGTNFQTLEGEFPVIHTVPLPPWVEGRWCSVVTYSWWPSWSQRGYSIDAPEVCFETSEYE